MAGYTYDSYVDALQVMAVSQAPDAPFDTILPSIIDYAEQRIYRELNLISTVLTDTSTTLTIGTRALTIPGTFVTLTNVFLLTPAGGDVSSATRVPVTPVSRDVLSNLWPAQTGTTGIPKVFCMVGQWSLLFGPSPDAAYGIELVGTTRPAALADTNQTTFISQYLPDLFMAASMVFVMGYQRNFSQQANDPNAGTSWEAQYQLLKSSADTEEVRKRFAGASWTSQPVIPQAQPQRG